MKQSDIVIPQGHLGRDLPDSEEDLFNIGHYPPWAYKGYFEGM